MKSQIALAFSVLCLAAASAVGAMYEAPLDVRQDDEAAFTEPPRAEVVDGKVRIRFAVSAPTDVEVAVLDARENVVRHLAAGLLGKNAPEPLRRDALKQDLVWDYTDDMGARADGGPFTLRVQLGVRPRLDRIVGWDGNTMGGSIDAITVRANGELYVLVTDSYRGRSEIRVLDRDGKYRRTIMPYPANTPTERTESVGHLIIDGERLPIVFNGQGHNFMPLTSGIRGQTMAWHPSGYLIAASSVGSMCEHGPPRYLVAFHPDGGAPDGVPFVGPKIRQEHGFMGGAGEGGVEGQDRLAVSRDGEYVYLVQSVTSRRGEKERMHGVFRVKWSDRELGEPWLGGAQAGTGEAEFSDPQGIAVDTEGRLYVCDRGNNRVKVYSADGKLLGTFDVPEPEQIAVHQQTRELFVLSRQPGKTVKAGRLLWFAAWGEGEPRKIAEQEVLGLVLMALEPASPPVRLWIAARTGWREPYALIPVTAAGGKFNLGERVGTGNGLWYPSMLAADPDRNRVIVKEHMLRRMDKPFRAIDLDTGEATVLGLWGTDVAVDDGGNLYTMGGYNEDCLYRWDASGAPLPFAATGSHKIPDIDFRAYGPDMGIRGHCVHPSGAIYVLRSKNKSAGAAVEVYGPDGRHKRTLVPGLGGGDCGIGVDAAGNIYLGINLKLADKPVADAFAGMVPTEGWRWWRGERELPWWYPYCNAYLWHMGSVFKFSAEGGAIYGNQRVQEGPDASVASPGMELANAPADAVPLKSAYLEHDVKVAGALWRYPGIGIVPGSIDGPRGDPGCVCLVSQLDADLWGRVYAPNVFRFCVEMLDTNGNHIARIGSYGNADSAGPGSAVPEAEIPFAWPTVCDYAKGKLYVSDSVNRRVVVVRFEYAATAECRVL